MNSVLVGGSAGEVLLVVASQVIRLVRLFVVGMPNRASLSGVELSRDLVSL